jgi:hypothetical protein
MTTERRVIVCAGSPGNGRDDILLEMRETAPRATAGTTSCWR